MFIHDQAERYRVLAVIDSDRVYAGRIDNNLAYVLQSAPFLFEKPDGQKIDNTMIFLQIDRPEPLI